jgi:PKD repeat protein
LIRPTKARAATFVLLGLTTIAGCSCKQPMPVVHVSPGTTVEVGQVVTFDSNRLSGQPEDYVSSDTKVSWDLNGDGKFELDGQRVVQTSFAAPGTYQVTFHAVNLVYESFWTDDAFPAHGYDEKVITVVAPNGGPTGNQAPTASFDPSPNPGYTERNITFDASGSNDPDGQVVKYEWDWTADGAYDESGTSPTATHKYDFAGAYTVRLRVTDDKGATGTTERTVQVQDGVPPGKVIARQAAGITTAAAGTPFSLGLGRVTFTPGTTTVSGAKLVTAGIRARGTLSFTRGPALLGRHRSPRWAGNFALVQTGNGLKAALSGQGYILLALSKGNSVCLATTAAGKLSGGGFTGRLAVAGGSGIGARLRGRGTFSPPVTRSGKRVMNGRLKLRRVHKRQLLPKACRTLARTLRR